MWYAVRYRRFASFGSNVRVDGRLRLSGPGRIIIGDGVTFSGHVRDNQISAAERGRVTIGDRCFINGIEVVAQHETVTIGARCIIGDCTIVTTDFHPVGRDRHSPLAQTKTGPVEIGANVWLAGRTVVLRGVTVGEDSVVAIGTIVYEDVPPGVIVSGQQLRVIRQLDAG
jgi:maltose O-acetyltransferase